ncbi:unnamed protein product, partial [Boreogadus saida]
MSNGNSSINGASGSNVSQGEIVDSARRLLDLITSAERQRSFPGMFTKARGKRRFPTPTLVPAKKLKPFEVTFYLLPKQSEKTPKEGDQILHLQAGLGRRTAHLDEASTHEELCEALNILFPKLRNVSDSGYSGRILKFASRGAKNQFIAPIQEELSTSPLQLDDESFRNMPKADCQKCGLPVPLPLLTEHIKTCDVIDDIVIEEREGWFTIADPAKAIAQCVENHLSLHKEENPLHLSMDIRSSPAEQDMALISFYKPPNVEWGRPLNCRLEGDTAIGQGVTRFFLSSCIEKLKSGFSIHFDLDIREMIRLLGGESTLSEKDAASVQELAYAWDLPSITETNRRWIFEKLLIHAVIGRVTRQIKQLRRGLKETPMWTVLTQRPDTVDRLLPKEGSGNINPEVLLQRITWPREDDEDADYSVATICCITGYLRQFIAHATTTELTDLVKFWTGWEILPRSLSVEVVTGRYPTASTCFEALRVPGHYKDYASFKTDVLASISRANRIGLV